jgi:pimeloyl-ACP methyl ester carboxylesterase
MNHLRFYGDSPYCIAVIHGGPGAGGEMAPVARRLAARGGVLEPIQTATTLAGQVDELCALLQAHAALPVTLVGYSWGAWLSLISAARYPAIVRKLVLVSSGPFSQDYVAQLSETRMSHLTVAEQAEFQAVVRALEDPAAAGQDRLLSRLGQLAAKSDHYDPIPGGIVEGDRLPNQGAVYQGVWNEAAALRKSGGLLDLARLVRCPIVAIHGDYDPHPAEGVRQPLAEAAKNFRFVLLEKCGHTPWEERWAGEPFYQSLAEAVDES